MRDTSSHAAAGISADDITAAALRLVRRRGVSGLTMRAVAAELGVRAPSLYHHIASKDQLLDLVARTTFESLTTDTGSWNAVTNVEQWIQLVRANSLAVLNVYRRHPGLAAAVIAGGDPHRDRPDADSREAELDALVRLGVPAGVARRVLDCAARWTVAAIAADGSPHSDRRRDDTLFRDGLDLLLVGMQARLQAAVAGPRVARAPAASAESTA